MKVSDILRVKGNTLYTAQPEQALMDAVSFMADKDLGSLVVMDKGQVTGMLTFREVIQKIVGNGGQVGASTVAQAMEARPLTCSPDTDIDEVRRMMLERHARYMCGRWRPADGRDQLLRRGQSRGRRPELRKPDAQGLHP